MFVGAVGEHVVQIREQLVGGITSGGKPRDATVGPDADDDQPTFTIGERGDLPRKLTGVSPALSFHPLALDLAVGFREPAGVIAVVQGTCFHGRVQPSPGGAGTHPPNYARESR